MAEHDDLVEAIRPLAESLNLLHHAMYYHCKPEVEALIHNKSTDTAAIERLLAHLFDTTQVSKGLALFKKLCRNYESIDPVAATDYMQIYREMYDN